MENLDLTQVRFGLATMVTTRGDAEARERAAQAFDAVLHLALRLDGTVTGEHGIGLIKRPALREPDHVAIDLHTRLKAAFDPADILNPGKVCTAALIASATDAPPAASRRRSPLPYGRARPPKRPGRRDMDVPDVLLLDVNETLTDLEPLRRRFTDVGAPESLLGQWFAATLRDGFALTAADAFASFGDVAAGVLQTLLPAYGVNDVTAAARHVLGGFAELPVHADVVPGLARLHAAGVRLATLTNGSVATSAPVLERAGLLPFLEQRLSVDDAGRWKPHREAYLYAVGACGVEAARAALVAVHPWDVDGALRAGLGGVWIDRRGTTYPSVFSAPTLTVRGFDDLADALGA